MRRERPHPGAWLSLFEHIDGCRYQTFVTNTKVGQLAFVEARHRAHARVENHIRHAKGTGLGRFPSREFAINTAWLTCVVLAADFVARTRLLVLHGDATVLAMCDRRPCGACCDTSPRTSSQGNKDDGYAFRCPGPGQARSWSCSPTSQPSPTSSGRPRPAHDPKGLGGPQPGSASRHPAIPRTRNQGRSLTRGPAQDRGERPGLARGASGYLRSDDRQHGIDGGLDLLGQPGGGEGCSDLGSRLG